MVSVHYNRRDGLCSVFICSGIIEGAEPSLSSADPEDFVSHSELVSFAVLEEVRTISITVNDDSIVESTEEFFVLLEVPPDETGVMIPQSSSSVFIIDNDSKHLLLGTLSQLSKSCD